MPSRMGVMTSTSAREKSAASVASPGIARASAAKYCTGPSKSSVAYCELMRDTMAWSWRSSVENKARDWSALAEKELSASWSWRPPLSSRAFASLGFRLPGSPIPKGFAWTFPKAGPCSASCVAAPPRPSTTWTKTSSSASSGWRWKSSSKASSLCTRPFVGSSVSTPRNSVRPASWLSRRWMAASVGAAVDRATTDDGSMPTGQTQTRVWWPSCSMRSGDVSMPSTISQELRKWRA
mmetsp:Transcript_13074/g.44690  ORF Transcript_13074/g.44690 Transcript_13074/m.44690 type:complete len:237 (-) Transcript_13074:443-1153(-)